MDRDTSSRGDEMSKPTRKFGSWIEKRDSGPGYWKAAIKFRLANRIGDWMTQMGMSRADLAREVGHSRSYITQVLGGNKNLTIDSMVTFAGAFGLVPRIEFVRHEEFWCDAYYFNADFPGIIMPSEATFDFGSLESSWGFSGDDVQPIEHMASEADWEWEKAA